MCLSRLRICTQTQKWKCYADLQHQLVVQQNFNSSTSVLIVFNQVRPLLAFHYLQHCMLRGCVRQAQTLSSCFFISSACRSQASFRQSVSRRVSASTAPSLRSASTFSRTTQSVRSVNCALRKAFSLWASCNAAVQLVSFPQFLRAYKGGRSMPGTHPH